MTDHVHFIGIGGSGISAIARLMFEQGAIVTGSDRAPSPFGEELAKLGIPVAIGHAAANVGNADWVVRSSAIPDDNPEVLEARSRGIPVYKRSDFLGKLMESPHVGIAIAGTHGKTTTTGLVAHMLTAIGLDPSYIVGGNIIGMKNAHFGKGNPFVIEADEYDRMFLGLKPQYAIITNLEHDHPDIYPTREEYLEAFAQFAALVPANGALIGCFNEPAVVELFASPSLLATRKVYYGIADSFLPNLPDQIIATPAPNSNEGFCYTISSRIDHTQRSYSLTLSIPGLHNLKNAMAVIALLEILGNPAEPFLDAFRLYNGTNRRFERTPLGNGVMGINDYAHHPTEIRATLQAARSAFAGRKIWAVWQPHTYSRTKTLFNEFTRSFDQADEVIISEIYRSREPFEDYSSRQVVDAIARPSVRYIQELNQISEYLKQHLQPSDVLLIMSAGDADSILGSLREYYTQQLPKTGGNHLTDSEMRALFGEQLQFNAPLAPYTTARIGGNADQLLIVRDSAELEKAIRTCWQHQLPFTLLGGGSNVLVSDKGVRGLVILNKAKQIEILTGENPHARAESGAMLSNLTHKLAEQGLTGLEWAATVPGTVGGAVYGNAGAYGGDIHDSLKSATILTCFGKVSLNAEQMAYAYRSSILKRSELQGIILSAEFYLKNGEPALIKAKIEELTTKRRGSQPPGASMGSMFKNPIGDHAGRLIEACGLKGTRRGNAEISTVHANFIVNHGNTSSADVKALIDLMRDSVQQKFGITLHLEVELIGEWE